VTPQALENEEEEDTNEVVVEAGDSVAVPIPDCDELGLRLDNPESEEGAGRSIVEGRDLVVVPFQNRDELSPELDDIVAEVVFVEFSSSVDLDLDFSTSELPLGLSVVGSGLLEALSVLSVDVGFGELVGLGELVRGGGVVLVFGFGFLLDVIGFADFGGTDVCGFEVGFLLIGFLLVGFGFFVLFGGTFPPFPSPEAPAFSGPKG
jgi:hypothetical protein